MSDPMTEAALRYVLDERHHARTDCQGCVEARAAVLREVYNAIEDEGPNDIWKRNADEERERTFAIIRRLEADDA